MYNDNPIPAPTTISFGTRPPTTAQRRGMTLRSESLFMNDRTYSLEIDSPFPTTTNALLGARSPRRHRSLLYPGIKVRAASLSSFRSRKSVASSVPRSPSIRTSPSPKRTRVLGKLGMAAIIGPLKALNFKKLVLNRGGGKQKAKHKATAAVDVQPYVGDFEGLLERNTAFDVDMDSQPLSARSFTGDIETDMEMMNIDSPTTQFAAYRDISDPFATPQPSATLSVDSGVSRSPHSPSSPSSSGSPGSRKNRRFAMSQEAALRSQLKTLQMLGPEARTVIAMKYSHNGRM